MEIYHVRNVYWWYNSAKSMTTDKSVIKTGGSVARAQGWRAGGPGSNPAGATSFRNFDNSVYLTYQCLSELTLKAVAPFYRVSVPGEVKDPTQGVNV